MFIIIFMYIILSHAMLNSLKYNIYVQHGIGQTISVIYLLTPWHIMLF